MKKRKLILVSLVMTIILIFSLAGVYAYYKIALQAKDVSGSTNISDESTQNVSSFSDLFTYGTNDIYNDISETNNKNKRYILKFTSDISLENNLVINNDIHIDLNDHVLNLNDYTLTIQNGYKGCFAIYNGTIESGSDESGNIIIDLPNMGYKEDNISYTKNEVDTNDSLIEIIDIDQKYTTYSALYYVADSINSDYVLKPEFKTYNEVSSNDFDLDTDKFVLNKDCYFTNPVVKDTCSLVYNDVILPNHYLSSDINITYSLDDDTYLKTSGKFTKPATSSEAVLTVTISSDSWDTSTSLDFDLHLVNLDDSATLTKCAKELIFASLSPYYVGKSLVVNEETILNGYYYEINHGITLPLEALDGKAVYSYSTTNYLGASVNTSSYPITKTIDGVETNTGMYAFEPNQSCYHLIVSINGTPIDPINMYSKYMGEQETIAYLIVNELYGGTIIYDKSGDYKDLATLAEIDNATLHPGLAGFVSDYNITGISYEVIDDAEDYFEIVNDYRLQLTNNVALPEDKLGHIRISIQFDSATWVPIDVYVNYLDASGNTLSNFLTYYNILDPMVFSELENEPLELPFKISSEAPYVVYDVATYERNIVDDVAIYTPTYTKPNNLNVQLYYNGAVRYTFVDYPNQNTSFTAQLEQHCTNAGVTLQQIASYSDAKYIFSVNAQQSIDTNTKMIIVYNYKFQVGDSWIRYYAGGDTLTDLTVSNFVLLGGLFYNTTSNQNNAVHNNQFFVWIYNTFKPSYKDSITTSSSLNTMIIPIDWLGLDYQIKSTDSALLGINDYHGIEYLRGVTSVDLSGINIGTIIGGISRMESVTELILKGCNITDITSFSNLKNVKVLDISNNNINYFDPIAEVKSLEKVYLYGNNAGNANIGSEGICNFQAYNDLIRNGCDVYNTTSSNIPVLFADSDSINNYRRLKAIIYQDKLAVGENITDLYSNFDDLTVANFGLTGNGSLSWSYGGGEDATDATYFMVTYHYGTGAGYDLKCKYYVDRYSE